MPRQSQRSEKERDKIVSEMLSRLPLAKVHEVAKLFQKSVDSRLLENCPVVLLEEARCGVKDRDRKFQGHRVDGSHCATCVILRMEGEKEPELKQLHVGGMDEINCQQLQLLITNLSQKALEMARAQRWRTRTWIPSAPNCARGQHRHQDGV